MTEKVPHEKVQKWWIAFQELDKDKSNSICIDEVGNAIRAAGCNPTEEAIIDLMERYDADHSGVLEFDEFVDLMQQAESQEPEDRFYELKVAFSVIDADGNGFLTRDELIDALVGHGESFTPEDVDDMIRLADQDGDNQLSIDEYINYMRENDNFDMEETEKDMYTKY